MPVAITLTRVAGFKRGEILRFAAGPITLGTDPACLVRFDPAWDRSVSARHAVIEARADGWWIRDTSQDGLHLKGRRLAAEEKLVPGLELEFGLGGPRLRFDVPAPFADPIPPAPASPAPVAPGLEIPATPPAPGSVPSASDAAPAPGRGAFFSPRRLGLAALLGGALWFAWDLSPVRAPVTSSTSATPVPAPVAEAVPAAPIASDELLAAAAKRHEKAVGLVVSIADGKPRPIATAWALDATTFATNGHVSASVAELLGKGRSVFIVINRYREVRYRVKLAVTHPRYNERIENFDGRSPDVPTYDVGLLHIEGRTDTWLPLAPRAELEKVDSGYRIAFLGFPMEGLAGGGVDPRHPVATMQSGIVTSATDWWQSPAEFDKRSLIQHNLGSTGGASGSPLFNPRGEVVGLLNAGNVIGQVTLGPKGHWVQRAPSAAMINFGQRVDLLRDIYPAYPKDAP
jgi:hypothetical protein